MTTDEVISFAFKLVKKITLHKHNDHKWSCKIWRFKQTSRINTEKAAEIIK